MSGLIAGIGGVYIAGGIVMKPGDWPKTSRFHEGFVNKGRYRDYLSRIPARVTRILIRASPDCRG